MNNQNNSLLPFLEKYGSQSIAYSTLQNGLQHFTRDNTGYAAYGSRYGHRFVLGQPICSHELLPHLVDDITSGLKHPAFIQIDNDFATLLHTSYDYKITQIGIETSVALKDFSLTDDSGKKRLRASFRKGEARSRLYELTQKELLDNFGIGRKELLNLTEEWLATRSQKNHLGFLLRPAVYEDEQFVRKFYSIDNKGSLLGFAFFDPIFKSGKTLGYCPTIMRTKPSAPMGHCAYIVLTAMDIFKTEGVDHISLGMSPVRPTVTSFRYDLMTHFGLRFLYRYGNGLYNFDGIYQYKKQFRGHAEKVFMATHKTFSGFESLAIMRFAGFI